MKSILLTFLTFSSLIAKANSFDQAVIEKEDRQQSEHLIQKIFEISLYDGLKDTTSGI